MTPWVVLSELSYPCILISVFTRHPCCFLPDQASALVEHQLIPGTVRCTSRGVAPYGIIAEQTRDMHSTASYLVIADGHRPIYTTSIGDGVVSVAQSLRNSLEPLLLKYQVSKLATLPCFCGSIGT